MRVCASPSIDLSPPPAIQIGSTARVVLTMQTSLAAALKAASSHARMVTYIESSVKDGVVLVLEGLGTGAYSITVTFEGACSFPAIWFLQFTLFLRYFLQHDNVAFV
jgi:hypothetical protein